ncbi:MAG: hypothetical protein IT443_10490 [Phycisphaeraceae bacterium]|nr:hypothetical protein [Phycisphaeraceae bacterium]
MAGMTNKCFLLLALFLATTIHAQTPSTQPASSPAPTTGEIVIQARHGQSIRGTMDGFPFLLLRGTHAQRGEDHGALAAREIIAICDGTATFLKLGSYASGRPDVGWEKGLEEMRKFTIPARYQTELAGMFKGIQEALPNPADRMLKSLGREITLDDLKLLQTGDVFELMRCSQFSAWGRMTADGKPVVGRNWDYPPLFPVEYACIIAVEPAEEGLSPTFDAMWFGMIGSGLATINRDGVYAAGNDGGIDESQAHVKDPQPGALLLRTVLETAPPDKVVEEFTKAIQDHVALGLLYHFVYPTPDGKNPAVIVEYDPRTAGPDGMNSRLRHPAARFPDVLMVTNHCMAIDTPPHEESVARYKRFSEAISAFGRQGAKIGFDQARDIMRSVAKAALTNTTLYTAVAWPAERKVMVAVAPRAGASATESRYVLIEWDRLFAIK